MPNQAGGGIYVGGGGLFNPSNNLDSASKLFMGVADNVQKRVKNRAINQILSTEKVDNEDAIGYQSRINVLLGGVDNMSPLDRLNLSTIASKPVYEQEQQEREQVQQDVENAYTDANLVQKQNDSEATQSYRTNVLDGQQTDRQATQGYRADTLSETKRHNRVAETPIDIREARNAGFTEMVDTGKDNADGSPIMAKAVTKASFEEYQKAKAQGKSGQKPLDASTVEKNKAMTAKYFDDVLFKQVGEDGYAEFNKLKPQQKQQVFEHWKTTGSISFGVTNENTFSSDDYGVQDTNTTEAGGGDVGATRTVNGVTKTWDGSKWN